MNHSANLRVQCSACQESYVLKLSKGDKIFNHVSRCCQCTLIMWRRSKPQWSGVLRKQKTPSKYYGFKVAYRSGLRVGYLNYDPVHQWVTLLHPDLEYHNQTQICRSRYTAAYRIADLAFKAGVERGQKLREERKCTRTLS